jgi:putative endonuclease
MDFYVYVLINPKDKKYTGSTSNLNDRVKMHNDPDPEKAKFHRTTFKKGPWELIFKKGFETRTEALKFEKFLKTGKGRDWLKRTRRGE